MFSFYVFETCFNKFSFSNADLESMDLVTISDASLTSFVSPEAKIEQIALTLTISLNGPYSPFNSCIISLAL